MITSEIQAINRIMKALQIKKYKFGHYKSHLLTIPLKYFRSHLKECLYYSEHSKIAILTKRGKPKVVIMPLFKYAEMLDQRYTLIRQLNDMTDTSNYDVSDYEISDYETYGSS
jgi:hypothetical protein